jgi:hypothetical protein
MTYAQKKTGKPSSRSAEFRNKAAASLRAARATGDSVESEKLTTTAKGYKALAAAEEWLGGEVQKSAPIPQRRKRAKARSS